MANSIEVCGLDGSVVSTWISCLEKLCYGYIREYPCLENYTVQYLEVMKHNVYSLLSDGSEKHDNKCI